MNCQTGRGEAWQAVVSRILSPDRGCIAYRLLGELGLEHTVTIRTKRCDTALTYFRSRPDIAIHPLWRTPNIGNKSLAYGLSRFGSFFTQSIPNWSSSSTG
jgi:hypothetical protein